MISSMTGFGRAELVRDGWVARVEIKSVNHRHLDMALRLPKQYTPLEEPIRRVIQDSFARGRLEIYVSLEEFGDKERIVKIDRALLTGYLGALREVESEFLDKQRVTFDHLLALPDVFKVADADLDWDSLTALVVKIVRPAVLELKQMRLAEGERLLEDICLKLQTIQGHLLKIKEQAPHVVADYRQRLRERLEELLEGTTLSEERFASEVAIYADRCSIDEELVRLASHIRQFQQSLQGNEPVGRKLDFLLQEMNREVNTIGSKANDYNIAALVVEIKSELEKVREQIQNIE